MSATKNTKTAPAKKTGPGRPSFKVAIPNGRFTFLKLCVLNGATDETGKPLKENARCVPLTLRNFLRKDHKKGSKSEIVILKDELGKSNHSEGLGRKPFVYIRRSLRDASTAKAKTNKSKAPTVSVPIVDTTPEPAPVIPPTPMPETATAIAAAPTTEQPVTV